MRSLPAKPACRAPANPPSDLPPIVSFQQLVASCCGRRFLSIDGAGEKMRINLADRLDVRGYLRMPQVRPHKSAPPLFCSQKTRIRVLRCQLALIAAPEVRVRFGDEITLKSRQKAPFIE